MEEDDADEVSDYEDLDEEAQVCTNVIKIKHTKNYELDEKDRISKISRDKPILDTPGDIYNVYYKPKSILKSKMTNIQDTQLGNKVFNEPERFEANESSTKENNFKFEPQKVK